ncbi:MAG: hypothetical protein Q4E13_08285 [Clostridia bacterium]|nr:hypothetical protein [Clostridia bacterium]
MKKKLFTLAAGLVLTAALAVPAMAQTTGIALKDKTLLIHDGQITIQEPGKPDRVIPLEDAADEGLSIEQAADGSFSVRYVEVADDGSVTYSPASFEVEVDVERDVLDGDGPICIDYAGGADDDGVAYSPIAVEAEEAAERDGSDDDSFYIDYTDGADAGDVAYLPVDPDTEGAAERDVLDEQADDGSLFVHYVESANALSDDAQVVQIERLGASSIAVSYDEDGSIRYSSDPISAVEEGTIVSFSDEEKISELDYSAYARFGLSYDAEADALYYQGQRVRVFEDAYPMGDGIASTLLYVDDEGIIDVQAQRDMTKPVYNADGSMAESGELVGLRALTDAEFAARDVDALTAPSVEATDCFAGEPMSLEEAAAFYAPYAVYGLQYDADTGLLTYQGQRVRTFLDIRQSNGEGLTSGRFEGTMTRIHDDEGEVDVETVRDYDHLDENGDGTLIGLKIQ